MAFEVEHVHNAFPNGLVTESFAYRNRLHKRSTSAVLHFDGALQIRGVRIF